MERNDVFETIAAKATPEGKGGVGIVRISGPKVPDIAKNILGRLPKIRIAEYLSFYDKEAIEIDKGIALFFKSPHSFTGEDVLELQGHGGPILMDLLLQTVIDNGARLARPGEFSERAYLNNKLDLVQAEAVADLINASSVVSARSALRSLQGDFSKKIDFLVTDLIKLRMYVEASIDFSEEEIPFLQDESLLKDLQALIKNVKEILYKAKQGALIREGAKVVIVGKPNAGKSSLLNALSQNETAIVTDIPGTTRDVLREKISLDGLVLDIIDTAGLRESEDIVEQEGIKRALNEIKTADHLICVVDSSVSENTSNIEDNIENLLKPWSKEVPKEISKTIFFNKIDKIKITPKTDKDLKKQNEYSVVFASVTTGEGMDAFREHLKSQVGFESALNEGNFVARRRHLEALKKAEEHLEKGEKHICYYKTPELLAEELKLAQECLDSITGKFTNDDLLGKIFGEFCVGK